MLAAVHDKLVFGRRVRRLAAVIAERLPDGARVLDVGCGSGDLAVLIMQKRPDVVIEGIDVLVRPDTAIPVHAFDGAHIPFGDNAFDAAIVVDVLHHTDDPEAVLAEIARIAPMVIIKDHLRDGIAANTTLRFMDWVGNAAHGVRLPYNYLSRKEWTNIWRTLDLGSSRFATRLSLYPRPFSWLFDRGLHFVTVLSR
ncbi:MULTISPECIES: class I SAM-dependent methyltransferase [unclassified Sphingomonas]|uniref:class I SAM-dependent methyltransferase n=1 Tax=unclassified Sphingomonas TaxID=196159 RepID=UPI0006F5DAC5|nr:MULTISPECIES: class I SAM-dependent methyltransferase [unclassified Sphingomonas]KQO04925.1 methyltransferase type 11 [Sphingomonas sp. Leaf242]KQS48421.1 methyltransferase type 11 [Sphingomonas sp. Leaf198]RMB51979.1 methyltransferase family protein [Sphingomonas sp. PP-CE-3A-406]TCP72773.1 methyltransferase family protein [Sphingomonas sp. PP-CE-1G-424]